MPEIAGDPLADLTTAAIFDDAVYQSEALRLADDQNEDDIDGQLAVAARDAGIEDPYRFLNPELHDVSAAVSTMTISSAPRSSMSIHSRDTQSTSVTSHHSASRTSRDISFMESSPVFRAPSIVRASYSMDSYDSGIYHLQPSMRLKPFASSVPGPTTFPATSSPLKPTPRKVKRSSGLGLFSIFRKESSNCPSRSHQGYQSKPLSPKLDCGHALSKYAIRVHVQEALESEEQIAPTCCGKPLPKSVLESVLSKEEADIVSSDNRHSLTTYALRDSESGDDGVSIGFSLSLDTQSLLTGSFVASPATMVSAQELSFEEEVRLSRALADETFKSLETQQKEQYERIASFESHQRKALSAFHIWSLKRLTSRLESDKVERPKQHVLELERLDEFQLIAEHDMRKAHAQEVQNVATALKYMEAYCSGANPTNPDVAHSVTEDDRAKLARQHLIQRKLPAKHESAINVLRARQEQNMKMKLQKQHAELQQLDVDFERDKRNEELQYLKDTSRLDALVETRRKRVGHRWDLKLEMWRRDWQTEHDTPLNGILPQEAWPEPPHSASFDSSSVLALYLQIMD